MRVLNAVSFLAACPLLIPALLAAAPAKPKSVALSGTVVVVNQKSDSITLVDLKTLEPYAHVPVVGGPHEAAVSPDGRSVVVTNYHREGVPQRALSVIELPSGRPIRTIELTAHRMPHDVRWVDDARVVCTVEADSALLEVNLTTGRVERVFHTGNRGSHMLALSTDRRRLYCSNMGGGSVSAFDFASGEKLADIPTGRECEGVGVTPDGRQLLVPHARSSSLVVCDVVGQRIVKSIPLGLTKVEAPSTAGVFPHPGGRYASVTVRNDDSMLVLDLEEGATVARVPVQRSPDGVCWSPAQR